MIHKELKTLLADRKSVPTFDVIGTSHLKKPKKFENIPDLRDTVEQITGYSKECLRIRIDEDNYYLLEYNVLYREPIKITIEKEERKFLGIKYMKKVNVSNEERLAKLFSFLKHFHENHNKNINIEYKKFFDEKLNKTFIGFTLRTYFINKNQNDVEEVTLRDFKALQKAYQRVLQTRKKEHISEKLQNFLEKLNTTTVTNI